MAPLWAFLTGQKRGIQVKKWVLKRRMKGLPKKGDMELKFETLPELQEGQYLAKAVYFSVDPTLRLIIDTLALGSVLPCAQIAKIRASKNKNYPVGAYVHGYFGWRTYTIDDGCSRENPTYLLPTYLNAEFGEDDPDYTNANFNRIRASYGLGILGMPGIAAYFGMMEILHPQEDEVVVVSTAAGAVGSMATQIAKNILGCKVIAITGKNSKGDFLLDYYAIDDYINYTTHDVEAKLNILAPEGVDCYFDNAGGEISNAVIANMNNFGRIAQCGATSAYCGDRPAKISQWQIIQKQLTVEGFHCTRWHDRWFEAMDSMHRWWRGHTLMGAETSSKGFLNFREAFRYVFTNSSLGKVIISRK